MATITLTGNTLSGRLGAGSYYGLGHSFSNARSSTSNLSNQLSNLRNKMDAVSTSTAVDNSQIVKAGNRENSKSSALTCGYGKLDLLVSNVGVVDNKTATEVERLKKDFYKKYNYLKPNKDKNVWDWIKDGAGSLWDGLCKIGDAIKKVALCVGNWLKKHWKELLIGLAFIVVGALITVFTGGTGTAFWAAFGAALLKGLATAAIAGAIGGAISGTVTYVGARASGQSRAEAFSSAANAFGDGLASGFMTGGIGVFGGSVGQAIGGTYKSYQALKYLDKGFDITSKVMEGFEYSSKVSDLIFPGNGYSKFYDKLSSNPAYKFFDDSVGYLSSFFGGASSKAKIKDNTYLNADGTYKKNVKFVTDKTSGANSYHTTDKKGLIKSTTSEGTWTKTVTKYDEKGVFSGLDRESTLYNFKSWKFESLKESWKDMLKNGWKFGKKAIDVASGDNKYVPLTK